MSEHAPSRRALIVAVAVLCMTLMAAFATSASATMGNFCPSSGNIGLNAYGTAGDRCAWVWHSNVTIVWYDNEYPNNAESCAALKPNSDGSGGDVGVPADCPNSDGAAEVILGSGYPGYATGINHSPHYHTGFLGSLTYT